MEIAVRGNAGVWEMVDQAGGVPGTSFLSTEVHVRLLMLLARGFLLRIGRR
jgi:hypothetical protein